MKCLAIGDLHFQTSNIDDSKIFITKLLEILKEVKPDFIVLLGDLLHTHEKIFIAPLKLITKLLKRLSREYLTFVIIGNHDLKHNNEFLTDNHGFNSFKTWENIVIVDKFTIHDFGEFSCGFCPYVYKGRFREAIGESKIDNLVCIFAHQEFKGCKFNPVSKSEDGDDPNGLPMIISGHIHDKQWVDNVYYTGTPYQHSYHESADKTIALLTFKESKSYIPKIKEISLGMDKKKVVYMGIDDNPKNINKNTKIVVKASFEEIKAFKKTEKYKNMIDKTKVSFHIVSENRKMNSKKKSMIDILYELIKNDEDAKYALQRIKS